MFSNENRKGGINPGGKRDGEELRRANGRGNCNQDILYKKRKHLSIKGKKEVNNNDTNI